MRMKHVFVLVFCVGFLFSFCSVSFAGTKVGYINLSRVVSESKQGKSAKEDIENLRRLKEAEAAEKLTKVNLLKQKLGVGAGDLTAAEKQEKMDALKQAEKDYQRFIADAKDEIARENRKIVTTILEEADDILKEVAKKKKYTIILKDPEVIGYLDEDVDITDLVLKELNKKK